MSCLPQGVIISLKDGEGVVKSEKHGELPFDVKENLSDVEFTVEDVNEEVEFTVITVRRHVTLPGAVSAGLSSETAVSSAEIRRPRHPDQTGEGAPPPDHLLRLCVLRQQGGQRSKRR